MALIHGICIFEDGFRAAAAASIGAPSLMDSTSDCAMLLHSRRTKDGGIMREMSLSMRVPLVASNELAIVTKSIAFVSPPRTTDNLVENCP